MYKQSPSRNHRSKGIKVKNVLQICLLLAVCFWLIYQVKHSHDKKKEFDENDTKTPIKTESSNKLVQHGRKDLLPRIEGLDTNEKHREEPEDETVEEEEENKPEEEDVEENNIKEKNDEHKEDGEDVEENNIKEKNDEHREDGEDEIDDRDQEKSDVEPDQEEDIVDEDKERGEDNEKETEERDSEVNDDSQAEEENSLEDHGHEEDSSSSHEAREEHYKADDASSAVTHDTAVTTTENDSGKLEQEAEHAAEAKSEVGVNNIMQINAGQNTTAALEVEDGKTVVDGPPQNTTNNDEKGDDLISSTARDTSDSNSTKTGGLTDNSEPRTQAVNQEDNVTVGDTMSGSNLSISSSQQNNNSTDMVDDSQIDSNSTVSSKNDELESTLVNSTNVSGDSEPSLAEKVVQGNATVEAVDNNATEVEKADTTSDETGTTDEGLDTSIAENLAEGQDDPIDTSDSSVHLEEKHIRTDVETLPEIQTEGNMEDAAAE